MTALAPTSSLLPAYSQVANLPKPAHLPLPTLSVNQEGRVYLQYAFVTELKLTNGQAIDLVPPQLGSPYWHLDLRPIAAGRVKWYRDQRPRFNTKSVPADMVPAEQLLWLCLLPGEPQTPGFYPMLPSAQLTHAFTSFLQAQAMAARTR